MISGWVTAFFCVGSIVIGGLISLMAIVQFYSLAYISVVLIFQVFYVVIRNLGFNKKKVLIFWLPKIFLSMLIWVTLYFDLVIIKYILLAIFTVYLIFDGRKELNKVISLVRKRL